MSAPFLDACLIVKNEEGNLPRCLASLDRLRPLLETVHVYDTGSTDATVAVARAAGCHVVEGYWDGDFARARNESLALSQATWVVVIDADEEVEADPVALRAALEEAQGVVVVMAPYVHVDEAGLPQSTSTYIKLLRRGAVRYEDPVHERAVLRDGSAAAATLFDPELIHVRHWGYASPEIRQAKGERNVESARAGVAAARRNGDTGRLARALFHEGRTLALLGRHDEAAAALREAWDLADAGGPLWCDIASQLARTLTSGGRPDDAIAVVSQVHAVNGCALLARVLLSHILLAGDDAQRAFEVLEGVPDHADPTHRVDPNAVATLRLTVAQTIGRQDEVLARLLVAVGERGQHELIPSLIAAWGDQPASLLARLLGDVTPRHHLDDLRAHLARSGGVTGSTAADLVRG